MKDATGTIGKIIGVAIIIGTIYFSIKKNINEKHAILQNKSLVIGFIEDCNVPPKREGVTFYYKYTYKGKNFEGVSNSYRRNHEKDYCGQIIHRYYPVAIDSLHPDLSNILIIRRDFAEYDIAYPDSLNYAAEYIY